MASGSLDKIIYELSGEVKWISSSVISQSQPYNPKTGKLCLSQLVDSFYIQCIYDHHLSLRNKKIKLDVNQLIEATLSASKGKFAFSVPIGGTTRFVAQKADENEIEKFICYLDEIKKQVMKKAAIKNKNLIRHVNQQIPRLFSIFQSVETMKLATPVKTHVSERKKDVKDEVFTVTTPKMKTKKTDLHSSTQQTNMSYTGPLFTVTSPTKVKKNDLRSLTPQKNMSHAKPSLSFTSADKIKNTDERDTSKKVTWGKNSNPVQHLTPQKKPLQESKRSERKRDVKDEDDFEKENINFFDELSPEKKKTFLQSDLQSSTPQKDVSYTGPLFTVTSPKKKEKRDERKTDTSMDVPWGQNSCLGHYLTPQKKRLQESSPQLPQSNNVKAFYGNGSSNSGLVVKRRIPRPKIRSSLTFPPSTSPTPIRRDISSTISQTAPRRSVKHSNLSSYSAFADGEVTSHGFTNLGNTCYMNAILQSLLGLVPFVQELDNFGNLNAVGRKSLYAAMYDLFRYKNDNGSSVRKKDALGKLKKLISSSESRKRFSGHLQNDAHEFMNICLEQMKEEVEKSFGEESTAKICPVVRNFEGSLRKYIRCKGCKDLATKDELFNHLSLNIPQHSQNRVNLANLLGCFFQEEELERNCGKCKCGAAVQQLQIRSLPRVLILHLLRSEYRRGTQKKNSNSIQIDRYLDLGDFCSPDITGPTPFICKTTGPSESLSTENDTPLANEDLVNFAKPRRRLDMSAAEHLSYSDKKPGKSASQNSRKYPDWVDLKTTPTLSPSCAVVSDSSDDDDDDLKQAKRASLREKQLLNSIEEEQIKRVMIASLQTEPLNFSEEELLEQAKLESMQSEKRQLDELSESEDLSDDVKTPSKRRKVDKEKLLDDEDSKLKRALELSKKEHEQNMNPEESQIEEAIKLSLEDGWKSAAFEDMVEDMLVENPEDECEPEKTRGEQTPSGNVSYRLVSVVNHIGSSPTVGHYTSHVYDVESDQWTRYNDTDATKISEYKVRYGKNSDGYIYFYMHKDCIDLLRT